MKENIKYPEYIQLAILPTPLQRLERLSKELEGPDIYIKRDDLTGCATSGNKVRKLEFVVADALKKGADTLITCGWLNSNHARATAIVASQMGLKSIVFLRGEQPENYSGNLFLQKLAGAEFHFLNPEEYNERNSIIDNMVKKLHKNNRIGYAIPAGATFPVGLWGYIRAFDEINSQIDNIKAIFIPVGTGGTYAGLFIGKKLLDTETEIIGINVENDADYFINSIGDLINSWSEQYRIPIEFNKSEIKIKDGYQGKGYSQFDTKEVDIIQKLASTEGIILDPVYTGKCMKGLIGEISKRKFNEYEKIIFLHTGGIFGLLSRTDEINKLLNNET